MTKEDKMRRTMWALAALGMLLLAPAAMADWTPAKRLTWNSGTSGWAVVAADSSSGVHLVWTDLTPGNFEVYYKKSTDGGATWAAGQRLTSNSGSSGWAAIAVDSSSALHILWEDDSPGNWDIYYAKSSDGGATWSTPQNFTSNDGDSHEVSIAADLSGNLHVAWHDNTPGNYEVYYRMSSDGGTSWTAAKRLTWTSGDSGSPDIAVDSSNHPHIVWQDSTPGNQEIYYRKSDDAGGAGWSPPKRLSWNSGTSYYASLAVDQLGKVHVVWHDSTPGDHQLFYRNSTDGGSSWTPAQRLTWTTGWSFAPAVVSDSSNTLHLVWNFQGTPSEIFYKNSTDGGAAWSPRQRLSWTDFNPWRPDIAVDPFDNLHVVWHDDSPGNFEVYYRKFNK